MLLLYLGQRRLLYHPTPLARAQDADPGRIGLAFEEITLVSADGPRLSAWFIPAQNPRATLLFCHGNAGNIAHRLDSIRLFHELGLSVLIFDYRGFGRSEGVPGEEGTYLDALAAWTYLSETRGLPAHSIILFGRSLGGAVAAELATQARAGGLVLESTFTSVPDLASELYPWLPVRLLSRFRYDTLNRIGTIDTPLMILHSRDDELIPIAHGERLFAAARAPKRFVPLRGGHNNGYRVSEEEYLRQWTAYLDTLSGPMQRELHRRSR
ncbi:MAG: alpha/beta hydrolase [Candidatus Sedimenticola endophacoides]